MLWVYTIDQQSSKFSPVIDLKLIRLKLIRTIVWKNMTQAGYEGCQTCEHISSSSEKSYQHISRYQREWQEYK